MWFILTKHPFVKDHLQLASRVRVRYYSFNMNNSSVSHHVSRGHTYVEDKTNLLVRLLQKDNCHNLPTRKQNNYNLIQKG